MSFSDAFSSRAWPRVAILALIAVAAAGCSDSARFGSNRSEYYQPPKSEVTGSISRRPVASSRVASEPLPAPSKPKTVAAYHPRGTADGGRGFGSYRPARRGGDVTGSVPAQPAGHWTWNGGTTVAIARGQTLASLGRTYHVPASAIMQVNHISDPRDIKTGQRIVIPRWVSGSGARTAAAPAPRRPRVQAPQTQAPRAQATQARAPRGDGTVHVAVRGDTLIGIARRHGMSLSALARYNHMSPFTKLNVGERVAIPAGRTQVARYEPKRPAPAPRAAPPRVQAPQSEPSQPAATARVARSEPEPQQTASADATKKAEPAGGIPQFRWPVKGRIIAGFGREPNGTQNDGINLSVPVGTPIKAADDGVVAYAGNELKGYGNLVLIRHADHFVTAYANNSKLLVHRGEHVRRGQVIARSGQTGNVTSPQLHFEIRRGSRPVDPSKYLGG
jgi:murein DD-endopeptidase MepM/ murein hydrolase activator NlpD